MRKYILKFLIISISSFFIVEVAIAEKMKDPTKPFQYNEKPTAKQINAKKSGIAVNKLKLQGIITTKARKIAIINGKVLKVHDKVKGKEIISIDESSVTLRSDSKEQVLRLQDGVKKRNIRKGKSNGK